MSSTCHTNGYIDDLITAFLGTPKNCKWCLHATPLVMNLTSRSHAGNQEPIVWCNILPDSKLIAKGTPTKTQIVLGWLLNTPELIASLSNDKYTAWTSALQLMADSGHATFGDLAVGHLNHALHIIPLARHFLNWLRL